MQEYNPLQNKNFKAKSAQFTNLDLKCHVKNNNAKEI